MFTLFHISETIEVTEKTEDPTTESEEKKEEIDFKEQKKDKDQTSKKIFWNNIPWKFPKIPSQKTRENEMNKFHGNNLKFFNSCGKKCSTKKFLKTDIFLFIGLGLSLEFSGMLCTKIRKTFWLRLFFQNQF